jgi:hypothetical protein
VKKFIILGVVILVSITIGLSACRSATKTPVSTSSQSSPSITESSVPASSLTSPTSTEAPDDIVITPGGYAYRANVIQQGVLNPWPPVHVDSVTLDDFNIYYRASIETKAGETRNNIILIEHNVTPFSYDSKLTLNFLAVPDGILVTEIGEGERPGILGEALAIKINPDVAAGQFSFKIEIVIDSLDYGSIPCTINVTG